MCFIGLYMRCYMHARWIRDLRKFVTTFDLTRSSIIIFYTNKCTEIDQSLYKFTEVRIAQFCILESFANFFTSSHNEQQKKDMVRLIQLYSNTNVAFYYSISIRFYQQQQNCYFYKHLTRAV